MDLLYKELTHAKLKNDIQQSEIIQNKINSLLNETYEIIKHDNVNYITYFDKMISDNNKLMLETIMNPSIDNISLFKNLDTYITTNKKIYTGQHDNIFFMKNNINIEDIKKIKENENIIIFNSTLKYNLNDQRLAAIKINVNESKIFKYFNNPILNICSFFHIKLNKPYNYEEIHFFLYSNKANLIGFTDNMIIEISLVVFMLLYYNKVINTYTNLNIIIEEYFMVHYKIANENKQYIYDFFKQFLGLINHMIGIITQMSKDKKITYYLT